ncbi:hypothetical protein Acr_22g0005460 [Actinidia rufa]|uniref:Uncharacterized protein n=1 Tax=Actinidia rufa TaxID=165716 RepID=A0A7J0GK77_9ERIC|nr:hypothetical protein Acr_22g0005460 [Actinidia rufa]
MEILYFDNFVSYGDDAPPKHALLGTNWTLLSEKPIGRSDSNNKFEVTNQAIGKEENEQKAALLETELREIRERYFQISLKYAEVEAQREQLVMKLKAVNSGKRRKVVGNTKDPVDGKLVPNWEGPYKITKLTGKGAYHLEDLEGKQVPRLGTPTT